MVASTSSQGSRNSFASAIESLADFSKWGKKDLRQVEEEGRASTEPKPLHTPTDPGYEEKGLTEHVDHVDSLSKPYDDEFDAVAQHGKLYRDGHLVLLPAPTKDPRDPLNLSFTRKCVALGFLCMFGAMAAAAELILGAMLPVFVLLYSGIDPKKLLPLTTVAHGFPEGTDPLKYLQQLPHAPVLWHVYLLASMPILIIGLSNLFFIPLAVAVGRRTIIICAGFVAIGGACWAGASSSLWTHIGARCIQAIGAGTVESLIPFIVTDISHVHQRNLYLATVFSAQGLVIVALGFAAPYIIIRLSWRWCYFITAAAAGVFIGGIILFLPETKWDRTRDEINGIPRVETQTEFLPRSWAYDLRLFQGKMEWRRGLSAFLKSLQSFFFPHIFFITILNSAMIACALAAAYTAAPALLTRPWSWPFLHIGFCLIPILIGAGCVYGIAGHAADRVANFIAKKKGKRTPENQFFNLALPILASIAGAVLYGLSGEDQSHYSQYVFLVALALMTFGFLGANAIGAVYVLECFPHMAGPALVNIASFRAIIAFALSFKVAEWMVELGYFKVMMIYVSLMAFFGSLVPVFYYIGPWCREHFKLKEAIL